MREVSVMGAITNDFENIIFHNKSWAVAYHQMEYAVEHNIYNIRGDEFLVVYFSLAGSVSFREYIPLMHNGSICVAFL